MATNSEERNIAPAEAPQSEGISRRKFLKILGASSAAGVTACTDSNVQNIFPNVRGNPEQIPGVAVWYSSTCTECSSGCGIMVRTREGRAVKVEGNPDSPVNRGGLCALGQSSLQHLYDPDRIRQPLERSGTGFKPISWDDAYAKISSALKSQEGKKAFLSGATSGATDELIEDFSKAFGFERTTYDLLEPTAVARASELVYGVYGVPTYKFDKAEVVVNFGADFLETWISPVEYARGWADGRRREVPLRFVHIEPRLSLTGANADLWVKNKAGSEAGVALALLKVLLETGKGEGVRDEVRADLHKLTDDISLDQVARDSGVSVEKILVIARYLKEAKSSLVLAGGTAASTSEPLPLHTAVNFLNLVLGNVGQTISLAAMRKPRSSVSKLVALGESLKKGEVTTVFVYDTNPAFTLPSSLGLGYSLKNAQLVVAFASHLDETAELAHLILPPHTGLEKWGDVREMPGVYGLVQPSMAPVFDTRDFGDMLLGLAAKAGNTSIAGGSADFRSYVKASWKKMHGQLAVGGDFERFWLEALDRGGYFDENASAERARVHVSADATAIKFDAANPVTKVKHNQLLLYPYPSVRTFDGRAANRPWLQELPDPITQAVWDSWAEIHPETAAARGIAKGDTVSIQNEWGEMDVPVIITEHVDPGIIAVPLGTGHSGYGRYASKTGGGSALSLLSDGFAKSTDSVALLSAGVEVRRGREQSTLVTVQGSDSQIGRGLARTALVGAGGMVTKISEQVEAVEREPEGGEHGEEHEVKQMYVQRQGPLYEWAMAVDLTACTGCSACVVACYAENNIPVVGKKLMSQGREMSWLRIERYFDGSSEELQVSFLPMMCQHCHNAPCEPVCPVFATYHNEEGLNAMVYNRCVGTRYCSNNCSYKVRRFNWVEVSFPTPLDWQLNPDVTKRTMGIMEKCTFCIQRISEAEDRAKDMGRPVKDGEVQPACVQACPTKALTFGNRLDADSAVSKASKHERAYKILDKNINTQPAVSYLERVKRA